MKVWISFFFRYILVGIIAILIIIIFIPTAKKEHQNFIKLTSTKLNLEKLDFGQLAIMFKSIIDNTPATDSDLEIEQSLIIEKENVHTPTTATTHNTDESWGIVSAPKASYYTRKGEFIGHLPAGTVLTIIKITETKKGPIAVCRPFRQKSSEIILTNPNHLTIRHNNIYNISKELEQLYTQQAQLEAEVATTKKQQAKELRRDNPHARRYAICKREYHDYWRKVKDLTEKRDAASNKKKMDYADNLRLMKGNDIIVANKLKQIKSEYDNWNLGHPRPTGNNNEVENLLTELSRIEKIISKMESILKQENITRS